jgi:methyl-accepting chemotaxis protein
MNFELMSLKKKIVLSFLFLIFLFTMVLIFLLNSQNKLGALQDTGADLFKESEVVSQILLEVTEIYTVAADGEINHNLSETKKDLEEIKKKMPENIAALEKIADEDKEKKWAEEFKKNYIAYVDAFEKEMLPELEKVEGITPKVKELDDKIDKLRDEAIKPLKLFHDSIRAQSVNSDQIFDTTFKRGISFSLSGAVLVSLISIFLALYISTKISHTLNAVKSELLKTTELISSNSSKVAKAAEQLSESTTEQASAIQETSASMEEMNSMIKKTAESATESTRLSRASADNAEKGKQSSENLTRSVNEINENNKNIMSEVQTGNKKIGEIVNLINDIGAKTKVINDIVFQTKLLSFNASVEAARAGEQGKGFAVVAEEIGSLAEMSGKAAMEISTMLDESTKKVKSVIEDTQRSVGDILVKGGQVVDQGLLVAEETASILKVINEDVRAVDGNIEEISVASNEQAKGAEQVAQALQELDQATQNNSGLSQQLFAYSKELSDQTEKLQGAVSDLQAVVDGAR